MKRTIVALIAVACMAVTTIQPTAAQGRHGLNPNQSLLLNALKKSVAKGWVYGSGQYRETTKSSGTLVLTFHGTSAMQGKSLWADLTGKMSISAHNMSFGFPYHVVVDGNRGAAKVSIFGMKAHYQCYTKGSVPHAAGIVQNLIKLAEGMVPGAATRNLGHKTYKGQVDTVVQATVTTVISENQFKSSNPPNSPKDKVKATVTFWITPDKLIARVVGTMSIKAKTKANSGTAGFSASFSHWGQAVAITMPKRCP